MSLGKNFLHKLWISLVFLSVIQSVGCQCQQQLLKSKSDETQVAKLSDLKITDVVIGTGAEVQANTEVEVRYKGWLRDVTSDDGRGLLFDDNSASPTPLKVAIGQGMVIKGWDKGLVGMKVGGRRQIEIPNALAYGEKSVGKIPSGADLIFEIELLSVK
jgi:FKBP-type peptidyl-prolyl cis-trans isomerase